jgi:hypothetical protein
MDWNRIEGKGQAKERWGRLTDDDLDDKSRYFRLAVLNYERANATRNPKLKAKFIEMAVRYRDLALEIDDAESRRGYCVRKS